MDNIFGQFIILCWVIFPLYWIVAALSVKRTAKRQRGRGSWGWRFPIFLAVLLAVFLDRGVFLKYAGHTLWHRTFAVGIIADLITLIGLVILIWARRTLGGNWSFDVVIKENHELIEYGPYAYVRHPIYSGFLLMTLGAAIFSGYLGAFIVFAILFSGFWLKSRHEERLLIEYFPEAYPKYKKKVRAFIPLIF